MFSPVFTINNKILKNIGAIEAAKAIIDEAPLIPAYEKQFQQEAVVRTVHYGTRIEGNDLTYQEVARLAGISPARIQTAGFVLVGCLSALSGMLLMSRIVTGNPTIGLGWELNVIAGVVIGGVSLFGGAGSILGAVLGLLIMQVVTSGLVISGVDPYWQTVSVGVIMITAVAIDVLRRKSKIAAS